MNQLNLFEKQTVVLPEKLGKTVFNYIDARDILTRASGFMSEYDYTINPYSGCQNGCIYCYAKNYRREQEEQDSWGYWVNVKQNAISLMNKKKTGFLNGKRIYLSSATDGYQPIEQKLELTRGILNVLSERHKPKLVIQTRNPLVKRDCDLFKKIEHNGGMVSVNMTITTDNENIRKTFEPVCASLNARLKSIKYIADEGIKTCITMTPLLLISDINKFADRLLDTGVNNYIIQPFHFKQGRFVASTRKEVFDIMSEKLNCDTNSFHTKYMEQYNEVFNILTRKLPNLGIGKDGFAPPF